MPGVPLPNPAAQTAAAAKLAATSGPDPAKTLRPPGRPALALAPLQFGINPKDIAQVKNLQRFLHNRGYDIAVDGKWGPVTRSAADNFTLDTGEQASTRNAGTWNISVARHEANNKARVNAGKPPLDQGGTPVGTTPTPLNTKPPKATGTADAAMGGIDALIKNLLGATSKDTGTLAQSQADTEFDPRINEQRRDITEGDTRTGNKVSNILKWFTDLTDKNTAAQGQDDAYAKQVQGDGANIMANLMGGATADPSIKGQLGKLAAINTGEANAVQLSHHNHQSDNNSAYALTGRESADSIQKEGDLAHKTMTGALQDLITGKAKALSGYKQAADDNQFKQKSEMYNILASRALLPAQIKGAGLGNKLTAAKIIGSLTGATPRQPKNSDYAAANKDALDSILGPSDPNDSSSPLTLRQFGSTDEMVKAVNQAFVGHGMHSTDKNAKAARDSILKKYGVTPMAGWNF